MMERRHVMETETMTEIQSVVDIVTARQRSRALAIELGFSRGDVTLIAAAISEVARNIVDHAKQGQIVMHRIQVGGESGIQIIATDEGPGIRDVVQALQYGYSTRKGLGVGLPGAKWMMDEFDIVSKVGKGTTVTMKKWLR
jgi:serine/threonine-protein kinase RsbT